MKASTAHVAASALLLLCLCLPSCQSRPVKELALADVALKSAQKVKADALAPDAFRQAENYYLRAKKDYGDGYYDASRKFADQARIFAEKAEYLSLLKQARLKNPSSVPDRPASDAAGSQAPGDTDGR